MGRGILVLLLAAVATAEDPDFGVEALRARVEALRPDVEASLGAPLGGAVEILVTTPDALKDLLARELAAQRARISGGPRGEALREACTQEATLASQILLAKVDLGSGAIHVCPENFRRIADLDPSWKGILSQDALDAVLLHEMVHVFQARRFGLARFVGAPPSAEQLTARSAVIEGHAQYVGRLAAKRRGLDAAAALIDRCQTEVPSSIKDPATRHFAEILGANLAFSYVEGERFVAAVAGELGYGKAVERIFASPPETLRAVSNPGEYLEPPAAGASLDEAASLVRRLLAERGGTAQVVPLAVPALRAALMPAGAKIVEGALRGFDTGLAVVSAGDPQTTVGLLRGRDEEAGKLLYEADLATSKAKDELFGKADAQIRIISVAYRPVSLDGADGIEAVKTVQVGPGVRQQVETAIVRRGALVVEAMIVDAGTTSGQAARLAREILELLRGAEVIDPWDGKTGDEARRALLGALGDPHWGVRWRATRNLARMKEGAEIDDALVRMLKDPDASVSSDAMRGIARRAPPEIARGTHEELAGHPNWEVRLAYQRTMAEQEADEEARASRLLAALEDAHPAVRAYAFGKLDDLEAQDRIPWERSRAGIEDTDGGVRLAAIEALGWRDLPPDAKDVLLKALGDENPRIRDAAVDRLDQWIRESQVMEALIRTLEDESSRVRRSAAWAFRDGGRAAAAAVPALVRLLEDDVVRETAAVTLGEIGVADPEAMRKIETFLDAPDLGFRFQIARALRRLGRDPKDLMPVFVEALRTGKDTDRDDAAEELGRLGEAARPHVADLVAALKDDEAQVRNDAAEALGSLGATAEEALPALDGLGGAEESPFEVDEDGDPVIGLGGEPTEREIRHAAREAAKRIRAALETAKQER